MMGGAELGFACDDGSTRLERPFEEMWYVQSSDMIQYYTFPP